MESVAEGLWGLADMHENKGEINKTLKCLEAIVQSQVSFLPIIEIKTRIRIARILLNNHRSNSIDNINHAKSHLERSQLLLKSIPSCFDLKCRAYSLLSQCYHLVGAAALKKNLLNKALELIYSTSSYSDDEALSVKLWCCNFNSQLANALVVEGDFVTAVSALDRGFLCATEICYQEMQMFFATSILHARLMQWEDTSVVERAVNVCDQIWEFFDTDRRQQCPGLLFYNEMLHIFYRLRICDYKNTSQHMDRLEAAIKFDMQQTRQIEELSAELDSLNQSLSRPDLNYRDMSALSEKKVQIQEQLSALISTKGGSRSSSSGKASLDPLHCGNIKRAEADMLLLAPPPMDGEWLPKTAVYALVDLMAVLLGRPKGMFKDSGKRIQSGMQAVKDELVKFGITDDTTESDVQHSAVWMAGIYLMILMQFLENKVAIDLTRSEFVQAQEALVQMRDWYFRFPTLLQAYGGTIEMLRGQYAHSVGCFSEAAFHFIEAAKMTLSKSVEAMCHIYAALSYICIGDIESYSQAQDLIGPIYRMMDSFVGVREKTSVLLTCGILLMKQNNLQEARQRLAAGLQITHTNLGNIQLVSQYLTVLGNLALALHDAGQAREILRSSLTLSKKLYDLPTQIWVLSVLTVLYRELGEKGNEMENSEYQRKKVDDLQKRVAEAYSSLYHIELVDKVKFEVQQLHELEIKRAIAGPSMSVNLDIPESVGLPTQSYVHPSSRRVRRN